MRTRSNLWLVLDRFPPILVRLLAKDEHGKPLSTQALADAGSLSTVYVEVLSQLVKWDTVPVGHAKEFFRICRIDPTSATRMKRIMVYLRGKRTKDGKRYPVSFAYLKKSPLWASYYLPLMERYLRSLSQSTVL